MTLPVQQINVVGIIHGNLPEERRAVETRIEETRVLLVDLEEYLNLLNRIGQVAGVPSDAQAGETRGGGGR